MKEIRETVLWMFRPEEVEKRKLSGAPIFILKEILLWISRTTGNPVKTIEGSKGHKGYWIAYKMGMLWGGLNPRQFRRVIDHYIEAGIIQAGKQKYQKDKRGSMMYFVFNPQVLLELVDVEAITNKDIKARVKRFIRELEAEPLNEPLEKKDEYVRHIMKQKLVIQEPIEPEPVVAEEKQKYVSIFAEEDREREAYFKRKREQEHAQKVLTELYKSY